MEYTKTEEGRAGHPPKSCCLCGQMVDDEVIHGKLYVLGGIFAHYYCVLFSSAMEQNGADDEGILGFLEEDIMKEVRRGERLRCSYCHEKSATIGCVIGPCRKMFHRPCGVLNGALFQFFGEFKSFCADHRPVQTYGIAPSQSKGKRKKLQIPEIFQEVPPEIIDEAIECPICYESVTPAISNDVLWAPCCKKRAWFHRLCVQKMALSSGYLFRCPICNDDKTFRNEMKEFGIHVPDQDASWEQVENPYRELYERHSRCDALKCLCSNGRRYDGKVGGKWEVVLCDWCGSQGIHVECGQLESGKANWLCETCKVLSKENELGNLPKLPKEIQELNEEVETVCIVSQSDSDENEETSDKPCLSPGSRTEPDSSTKMTSLKSFKIPKLKPEVTSSDSTKGLSASRKSRKRVKVLDDSDSEGDDSSSEAESGKARRRTKKAMNKLFQHLAEKPSSSSSEIDDAKRILKEAKKLLKQSKKNFESVLEEKKKIEQRLNTVTSQLTIERQRSASLKKVLRIQGRKLLGEKFFVQTEAYIADPFIQTPKPHVASLHGNFGLPFERSDSLSGKLSSQPGPSRLVAQSIPKLKPSLESKTEQMTPTPTRAGHCSSEKKNTAQSVDIDNGPTSNSLSCTLSSQPGPSRFIAQSIPKLKPSLESTITQITPTPTKVRHCSPEKINIIQPVDVAKGPTCALYELALRRGIALPEFEDFQTDEEGIFVEATFNGKILTGFGTTYEQARDAVSQLHLQNAMKEESVKELRPEIKPSLESKKPVDVTKGPTSDSLSCTLSSQPGPSRLVAKSIPELKPLLESTIAQITPTPTKVRNCSPEKINIIQPVDVAKGPTCALYELALRRGIALPEFEDFQTDEEGIFVEATFNGKILTGFGTTYEQARDAVSQLHLHNAMKEESGKEKRRMEVDTDGDYGVTNSEMVQEASVRTGVGTLYEVAFARGLLAPTYGDPVQIEGGFSVKVTFDGQTKNGFGQSEKEACDAACELHIRDIIRQNMDVLDNQQDSETPTDVPICFDAKSPEFKVPKVPMEKTEQPDVPWSAIYGFAMKKYLEAVGLSEEFSKLIDAKKEAEKIKAARLSALDASRLGQNLSSPHSKHLSSSRSSAVCPDQPCIEFPGPILPVASAVQIGTTLKTPDPEPVLVSRTLPPSATFGTRPAPAKTLPSNAESMNPVALLNQMRPEVKYKVEEIMKGQERVFKVTAILDEGAFVAEGPRIKEAKKLTAQRTVFEIYGLVCRG